jgi:hypothetical protein
MLNMAKAHKADGRTTAALATAESALSIHPEHPGCMFEFVRLVCEQKDPTPGQLEKATAAWEKLRDRRGGDDPKVREARELLRIHSDKIR